MFSSLTTYFRLFQIVGLGLVIWIVYYGYTTALKNSKLEKEKIEIRNYYAAREDTLVRQRDEKGRETVIYKAATLSPEALAVLKTGLAAEAAKAVRAEFGRNARLLYGQRAATTTTQILPTVVLRDTTMRRVTPAGIVSRKARAGVFKDPWLHLTGIVTDDSLSVKYSIRNEFDVRAYSKKEPRPNWWKFWKKREEKVYVDLKNRNPNTTTDKMEAVLVEKQ